MSTTLNFKICENNKNVIIFSQGNKTFSIVIPPTSGNRIDFIDRNFKYYYNYKRIISAGFIVIINNGQPTIKHINYNNMIRLHRIGKLL